MAKRDGGFEGGERVPLSGDAIDLGSGDGGATGGEQPVAGEAGIMGGGDRGIGSDAGGSEGNPAKRGRGRPRGSGGKSGNPGNSASGGEAGDIRPSQRNGGGGNASRGRKTKEEKTAHNLSRDFENLSKAVFRGLGMEHLAFRKDEIDNVASAWQRFSEAWFPDAEESILPPKATASFALLVAVWSMAKPRYDYMMAVKQHQQPAPEMPQPMQQPDQPTNISDLFNPLD